MRPIVFIAAALLAGCNSSAPTEQEQNLSERGTAPEQMANTGAGNVTPGTLPPSEQADLGDTMPDEPAGPKGDRGSATGGDSAPTQ